MLWLKTAGIFYSCTKHHTQMQIVPDRENPACAGPMKYTGRCQLTVRGSLYVRCCTLKKIIFPWLASRLDIPRERSIMMPFSKHPFGGADVFSTPLLGTSRDTAKRVALLDILLLLAAISSRFTQVREFKSLVYSCENRQSGSSRGPSRRWQPPGVPKTGYAKWQLF